MRVGKEIKLPPPAMEFMMPASTAAMKSKIPFRRVIVGCRITAVAVRMRTPAHDVVKKATFAAETP
jgi:hypothetical protein